MKLLIAIVSCERDRYTHDAIRNTWGKGCEIDYKFFMGRRSLAEDEISLNCDDSYNGLTEKALKTFQWSLGHSYDFMLHVGRDTYISLPRLRAAVEGLVEFHYAGHCGNDDDEQPTCEPDSQGRFAYASGGAGSWLSAHAQRIIIDPPIRHPADDLMFGWILGTHGIICHHDRRFQKRGDSIGKDGITVHLSYGTGNYDPQWMIDCHRRSLKAQR